MKPWWEDEWQGMPEYDNKYANPPAVIATFNFATEEDFHKFNDLLKQYVYNGEKPFDGMQRRRVKSTWYPLKEKASKYLYVDESEISNICD
jgi:hypothetical protein